MRYTFIGSACIVCLFTFVTPAAKAAHLAMGLRVGEVTQTSAIVWTRITKSAERNADGVRLVGRAGKKVAEFVPPEVPIEQLEGAVPGAPGEVRLTLSQNADFSDGKTSDWLAVDEEADFTRQFHLADLIPATRYYVRVEARSPGEDAATARCEGSFLTPAAADQWQDVSFAVITGQAYKDLDYPDGYHIYPAMGKLGLNFLVPTGDTVYYDSEKPRARTVDLARHHWHRIYSLPRIVAFHRSVPGYWEKDDHDTLSDDSWPTLNPKWMLPMTWEDGLRTFREQVPMGEKTYRTIRWGKGLQVWFVEGRDFRSPNTMPDGPDKSIWGKEQRAWLQKSILASDADFRVLVSPTPIVGPDRPNKRDNHSNPNFAYEGNLFRNWTRDEGLDNFYVCCGDRHWQYRSIDPKTKLMEFSCGPASDRHAGGTPGQDPKYQPFHRVGGGFLSVSVTRENDAPTIAFRFHDVKGKVVHEYKSP